MLIQRLAAPQSGWEFKRGRMETELIQYTMRYEVDEACQVSAEAADLIAEKRLDLPERAHEKT